VSAATVEREVTIGVPWEPWWTHLTAADAPAVAVRHAKSAADAFDYDFDTLLRGLPSLHGGANPPSAPARFA